MSINTLPLIPLIGVLYADIPPTYSAMRVTVTADGMHYLFTPSSGAGNQTWYVTDLSFNLIYSNSSYIPGAGNVNFPQPTNNNWTDIGLAVFVYGSSVFYIGSGFDLYDGDIIKSVGIGLSGGVYLFSFCVYNKNLYLIAAPANQGYIMGLYDMSGNLYLPGTNFFIQPTLCNSTLNAASLIIPTILNGDLAYGQFQTNLGKFADFCPNGYFSETTGFYTGGVSSTAYAFNDLFSLGVRYNLNGTVIQLLSKSAYLNPPTYFYVNGSPVQPIIKPGSYVLGANIFPSTDINHIYAQRIINGHPVFFVQDSLGDLIIFGLGIDSSLHGVTSNYSRLF